jgi:hypothetical protein
MPSAIKEKDLQRLVLDWLSAQRIWHIRLNTGAMSGSHKGKRWFVKFGKPGMADILAYPRGPQYRRWEEVPTWIELKATKGKQSVEQLAFQDEVQEAGMSYVLARSLEEVQNALIGA